MRHAAGKMAVCGILTALALALSAAERWIPLGMVIPVPGIRLGLANTVTMFALFYLDGACAAAILAARCLLASLFAGAASLPFSLAGGALALMAMLLLKRGCGRFFSLYGVSMGGAAAHNAGQVAMAAAMLGDAAIFVYLPALLLAGLAAGALTAAACIPLFRIIDAHKLPILTVFRQ